MDEYRQAMIRQDKSLLRITPTSWGPIATGGFPRAAGPAGLTPVMLGRVADPAKIDTSVPHPARVSGYWIPPAACWLTGNNVGDY